jgi:hypothetical protein
MAYSIQITIRENCDAETGMGGTVIDNPITVVPDQVFADMKGAWSYSNGWTETVTNPDFDPEKEVSEENPETISNPVSEVRNMLLGFRQRTKLLVKNWKKHLA